MAVYRSGKDLAWARARQHPVRATLLDRLQAATAPVSLDDLARAVDVALKHVRYHVEVLCSCGFAEIDSEDRAQLL